MVAPVKTYGHVDHATYRPLCSDAMEPIWTPRRQGKVQLTRNTALCVRVRLTHVAPNLRICDLYGDSTHTTGTTYHLGRGWTSPACWFILRSTLSTGKGCKPHGRGQSRCFIRILDVSKDTYLYLMIHQVKAPIPSFHLSHRRPLGTLWGQSSAQMSKIGDQWVRPW